MILKMWWGVMICFMLHITQSLSQESSTYAIYVPKYIRPGFDISITVSILQSNNPVLVTANFESSDNEISFQQVLTINSGSSERVSLGQIPLGYGGSTDFYLSIDGVDSTDNSIFLFSNRTTDFDYETKALSILIQTDKAIYQPGQIIKFRAVCLKPDLRPLQGAVQYSVSDPNGNIVLLERDVELNNGVVGSELQLSKDAVEGEWGVNFKAEGYNKTLTLTVEQYKLPKFEVEVEVPSYIHPGSQSLTIKLKGTYTFGKPVEGKGKLDISLEYNRGGSPVRFSAPPFGIPNAPSPPGTLSIPFNEFDGEVEYVLTKQDITGALGWNGESTRNIKIVGEVTETLTGESFKDTGNVAAETTNIKVEVLYKPETIKPGLTYTAYIQVTEQDGKPLTEQDRENNDLIVDIQYSYPRDSEGNFAPQTSEQRVYQIPADGIVIFTIEAKADSFDSVTVYPYTNSTNNDRYNNQFDLNRALSPSNTYLQIIAEDNSVAPGENAHVTIRTTEPVSEFRIQVISRGVIASDQTYVSPNNAPSTSHNYLFPVTIDMIPAVNVLVSYVRSDGEIVADLVKLTVETNLLNQVSVTSSGTNIDAGEEVSIRVQTSSPGSYVGARAIDKSVLLLKSGNDITRERVINDLNEYSVSDDSSPDFGFFRWWWWYPTPSGALDASEVFDKAGLTVLTDAIVYSKPQPNYYLYREDQVFFDGAFPEMAFASNEELFDVPVISTTSTEPIKARSYFPETWLWVNKIAGDDGSATFNTTAPDTITSWQLSVFSVSNDLGLGLTDPFKITVFRNFFVQLNFPLKITQNEIIIAQAIVFNYFESDLLVRVELTRSEKFNLLIPAEGTEETAGYTRVIVVRAGGATSIKFPIIVTSLGDVPITVAATSEIAGDQLTRNVFARPSGIEQCYSSSALIERESEKETDGVDTLTIRLPENFVPGSANVKLFVYGDVLGSTMSNLGNLLKMPSGCGEQNMLSFAPDVFVTLYLNETNKLDVQTRNTAFQHFRQGYMNELNYRHNDGSYSAFGKSDKSGSTWLTAFVAKCFMFAQKLQPELVEDKIVESALDFLINQQNKEGYFNEPGKVSHKDMQGGVNSDVTMAAYVLITLTETNYGYKSKDIDIDRSSLMAQRFLEDQLQTILENKYALAIVTYALHVSGSSSAGPALDALESLQTTEGNLVYWHEDTPDASQYSARWRPPYYNPPSNDIEMTAYALLTYVYRDELAKAAPVMKWLASKRSALGGYHSTQDTVIAIQAMSSVARLLVDRTQDLTINTFHSGVKNYSDSFHIDETNSIVFNSVQLPAVNGDLIVSSSGTGVGVAQLSVCYNVPEDPFESEPFICSLEVNNENVNSVNVDFCCSLKPNDTSTGMFLFEIVLLNGFNVDLDNEKEKHRRAQLVELDEDSINIYYDQLLPNQRLCANVDMYSSGQVGAVKPQPASAVDYYKTDRRVDLLYGSTQFEDNNPCVPCGSECTGCPAPVLGDWGAWSPCTEFCMAGVSTRSRHCNDPSNGKLLDPVFCGNREEPLESRPCADSGFPCPGYHTGIWSSNELPNKLRGAVSYDYRQEWYRAGRYTPPRISGSIPGLSVNGVNQYINFYNSFLTRDRIGKIATTISFLVKEESCTSSKCLNLQTVFLKFGDSGRSKPRFVFKRVEETELYLLEVNFKDGVSSNVTLEPGSLAPKRWNHVVLSWNGPEDMKVYINGRRTGNEAVVGQNRLEFPLNSWRENFVLGGPGSSYRRNKFEGFLRGEFSSLGVWNISLNAAEIQNLYRVYESIVQSESSTPLLSVRQLRQFSPLQFQHCFTKPATFEELNRDNFEFGCTIEETVNNVRPIPFGPFF